MGLTFHPAASAAIDQAGVDLRQKIAEHPTHAAAESKFPSEKPITATLTDKDIKKGALFGYTNMSGEYVARYAPRNGKMLGLAEAEYGELRQLADRFLKVDWVSDSISRDLIEEVILIWCLDSLSEDLGTLSDYAVKSFVTAIQEFEIWVPVAFLQVEETFEFGAVRLATITKKILDDQEQDALENEPNNADGLRALFADLRSQYQGAAAVIVRLNADQKYAESRALEIADVAVSLLRIYSAASRTPWLVCPIAVMGSEITPRTSVISFRGETGFSVTRSMVKPGPRYWQLNKAEWEAHRRAGLDVVGSLIEDAESNEYNRSLRVSLLTFSKGLTFPNIADRLVYVLSALEGLLLKDASESIQQNLGERMAFVLERDGDARQDLVRNVKDVYRLRSQYIHHRVSVSEETELEAFWYDARRMLLTAVSNVGRFDKRIKFVEAIERLKFGGRGSGSGG